MSNFGTPGRESPIRRFSGGGIPQTGITESLLAPGLVDPEFTQSAGARLLGDALRTVGLVGQGFEQKAQNDRADAGRAAQAKAENDAVEAKAEKFDRGAAVNAAQLYMLELQSHSAAGNQILPDGLQGEEMIEAVRGLTAPRTQSGSDSYRAAYEEVFVPRVAGEYVARQRVVRDAVADSMLGMLAGSASVTADTTELRGLLDHAGEALTDIPESQRTAKILLPALDAASFDGERGEARFNAIVSVLDGRSPDRVARARSVLDNEKAQQGAARQRTATDRLFKLQNDGVDPNELRAAVTSNLQIDESTRGELLRRIDARQEGDRAETQFNNANSLRRDIVTRRWLPDETGKPSSMAAALEVDRRMYLASDDPQFIPATEGKQLLNQLEVVVDEDARFDRVSKAFGLLTGRSPAVAGDAPKIPGEIDTGSFLPGTMPPLTPKDDVAMVRYLGGVGVLDVSSNDGEVVLHSIRDPIRFSVYAGAANRLPADAASIMRAGLTSIDPAQYLNAATAYASLSIHAPHLAKSLELDDTAALRARFIASRVERKGPSVRFDNEALRSVVTLAARDAALMKPSATNYTDEQALSLVWWGKANEQKASRPAEVTTRAQEDVAGSMKDSEFWKRLGTYDRWAPGRIGGIAIDSVPANVANTYAEVLADEFRFARALTPGEPEAAKAAKAWAIERTLKRHPPMVWNSRLFWTNAPEMSAAPDVERLIVEDLKRRPAGEVVGPNFDSARADLVEDLLNNYAPVWDEQQGGFMFYALSDPYSRKTIWTDKQVGPLVVDPFSGAETEAEKIRAAIAERRATKTKGK